jgi:quercetin 2,3-dioxygenase
VIAGHVAGVAGPIAQPATDPTYVDIQLEPGATFSLPVARGHSAFVYVFEGAMKVGTGESAATLATHELAVLGDGDSVQLEGRDPPRDGTVNRAILVAGRPLKEPVAKHGPFVMNTREELVQAFQDFERGRF